jgi:hypothetical protein
MVEGLNRDDPLGYYACALADDGKVYGNHPPSTKREIVNVRRSGFIQDGGKSIGLLGGTVEYDNLMIERKHLRAYIKKSRQAAW